MRAFRRLVRRVLLMTDEVHIREKPRPQRLSGRGTGERPGSGAAVSRFAGTDRACVVLPGTDMPIPTACAALDAAGTRTRSGRASRPTAVGTSSTCSCPSPRHPVTAD